MSQRSNNIIGYNMKLQARQYQKSHAQAWTGYCRNISQQNTLDLNTNVNANGKNEAFFIYFRSSIYKKLDTVIHDVQIKLKWDRKTPMMD